MRLRAPLRLILACTHPRTYSLMSRLRRATRGDATAVDKIVDTIERSGRGAADGAGAAARLLGTGRTAIGRDVLRTICSRIQRRDGAVATTRWFAALDSEFRGHISEATSAAGRQRWRDAQLHYERALALYPLHGGWRVQLGHSLKERGVVRQAEVEYRQGLALGEPVHDVMPHLEHVAAFRNIKPNRKVIDRIAAFWREPGTAVEPLDYPPLARDVQIVFAVLSPDVDFDATKCAVSLDNAGQVRDLPEAVLVAASENNLGNFKVWSAGAAFLDLADQKLLSAQAGRVSA